MDPNAWGFTPGFHIAGFQPALQFGHFAWSNFAGNTTLTVYQTELKHQLDAARSVPLEFWNSLLRIQLGLAHALDIPLSTRREPDSSANPVCGKVRGKVE